MAPSRLRTGSPADPSAAGRRTCLLSACCLLLPGLGLRAEDASGPYGTQSLVQEQGPASLIDAPIQVGGMTVAPSGIQLLDSERLILHPFALLLAGFDSNPRGSAGDGRGALITQEEAGLDSIYRIDEASTLTTDAQINGTVYAGVSGLDAIGFDVRSAYLQRGPSASRGVSIDAQRVQQPQALTGELLIHDQVSVVGTLAQHDDTASRDLTVTALDFHYDTSSVLFAARDASYYQLLAVGDLARNYRHDAALAMTVSADQIVYDDEREYADNGGVSVTAGWKGPLGDRCQVDAEVGIAYRHFFIPSGFTGVSGDANALAPAAQLTLHWPIGDTIDLECRGHSGLTDSQTSTVSWSNSLLADGRWHLDERTSAFAGASLATGHDLGGDDATTTSGEEHVGLDRTLRTGIDAEAQISYTASTSTIGYAYQRLLATLQVVAVY